MGTTERQWKGGAAWRERSVYTELTQLNVKQLYSIASTEIHIVVRAGRSEHDFKSFNKCVSRTDTNPPFAFQTAFPRGTDFSVSTGRVKKLHTLLASLYF